MSYPQSYLRFAVVTFYVFIGLSTFFGVSDLEHADALRRFATFGLGCAATMWWVTDSMHRRREIPFASLWLPFTFWMFVLPVHYFATRGASRIGRFAFHIMAALAVAAVGAIAGIATIEGSYEP